MKRPDGAFRALGILPLLAFCAWCQPAATPAAAMERGRAGDYTAALKGLRAVPGLPNAAALEAALLRAADDDTAAAAVLARTPAPEPADLMARFERVRQGQADTALWTTLEVAPERALELADVYLQWGLTRDALELLSHKGPTGAPSPDNALFFYYRSYCRALLDYPYYAAEDLGKAPKRSIKGVSPLLGSAEAVLQSAVKRNPKDAYAQYLAGLASFNGGHMQEALDALENALSLLPSFPDAEAALAKLPPGIERKPRPVPPARSPSSVTRLAPVVSAPKTAVEFAAAALRAAANGDLRGATSYFTPANFPNAKQEELVRQAYFELRVKRLLAAATARQCAGLEQSIAALGAPDNALPFAAAGFADLTKGVRIQYLIGVAYSSCGNAAASRKQWETVSKTDTMLASADYAYPILALSRLEPEVAKSRSRKALVFIARQFTLDSANHQGELFYSQGLLQTVIGKQDEAMSSFESGASAGPPGMVEYLNLEALGSGR